MREKLVVRARVRLLSTAESGRISPVRRGFSPNHNIRGPDNFDMFIGRVDIPEGIELHPGQSMDVVIRFVNAPGLERELTPGREWRIQEGWSLVGVGTVIEILPGA